MLISDKSAGRKENVVDAYTTFPNAWNDLESIEIPKSTKTVLHSARKEVDDLIAGCSRKVAAFLQLLKEIGMRAGEAWQLE